MSLVASREGRTVIRLASLKRPARPRIACGPPGSQPDKGVAPNHITDMKTVGKILIGLVAAFAVLVLANSMLSSLEYWKGRVGQVSSQTRAG